MRAEGLLLCSIEFAGIGSGKQASKQARDEGAADSFPMAICMEKRDVNTWQRGLGIWCDMRQRFVDVLEGNGDGEVDGIVNCVINYNTMDKVYCNN